MQYLFIIICISFLNTFLHAEPTSSADRLKVDGISANTRVVMTGRNPVFSWGFDYDGGSDQETVEIQVGSSAGASDLWNFNDDIPVTYQKYGGPALLADATYFWRIRITDTQSNQSSWIASTFHTVQSAVLLSDDKADLKIDWNNPFNPNKGQITKIVYQLNDSNEEISVRIYTVNGELVKTLAEHIAQRYAMYTVEWDGRNAENEVVASGVYLVNLNTETSISKTERVVVIK